MQETRQLILEILRTHGQATVEDIVTELQTRRGAITSVTVRHHLMRLQKEGLITAPELRRRSSPGRPQHIYTLTEKAREQFPNNYQRLAAGLLDAVQKHLPPEGVNVIIEGAAIALAEDYVPLDLPLTERLNAAVEYLTRQGYDAYWEAQPDGWTLHTSNCPYHQVATRNALLCEMDMRLIALLLGVVPRRIAHLGDGDDSCAYWIPASSTPLPRPDALGAPIRDG